MYRLPRLAFLLLIVFTAPALAGCTERTGESNTHQSPDLTVRIVENETRVVHAPDHTKANFTDLSEPKQKEFVRAINSTISPEYWGRSPVEYVYYEGAWYRVMMVEY